MHGTMVVSLSLEGSHRTDATGMWSQRLPRLAAPLSLLWPIAPNTARLEVERLVEMAEKQKWSIGEQTVHAADYREDGRPFLLRLRRQQAPPAA
jgi:hypothetical protein